MPSDGWRAPRRADVLASYRRCVPDCDVNIDLSPGCFYEPEFGHSLARDR